MSIMSSRRVPVLDILRNRLSDKKNYIFKKWDFLGRNTVTMLMLTKLIIISIFYIFFVKKAVRLHGCVL